MKENESKRMEVHAKSIEDVKHLYYFMCCNELKQEANSLNVVHLAHFYGMKSLENICSQRLVTDIAVGTFVETINVFNRYSISKGYDDLVLFSKEHVVELQKEENFNDLHYVFRRGILGIK